MVCPSTVVLAIMLFIITALLVAFVIYHFIYVSKATTQCPTLQEVKPVTII